MLTFAQITAILSLLLAFNVDVPTVNNVRAILTATEATTTPIATVPTVTTPIIENEPVYFGSTPVDKIQPAPAPVVSSPQMEEIIIREVRTTPKNEKEYIPFGHFVFIVSVKDAEGKYKKFAEVSMEAPDGLTTPEHKGNILTAKTNTESTMRSEDWSAGLWYTPISPGNKTIIFRSGEMTKTHELTVAP